MTKALEEQKRAIEIMPQSVQQRSNLSLYALYAGDFDAAAAEAQRVLKENPKFEVGVRTLALAKLAAGHLEEAQKEYGRLNDMSPRGASMAATGLADLAIYEGRLADAVAILHKVIIENQADKDTDSAAFNQATLAEKQIALGKTGEALATAASAATSRDEGILYRVAQVYLAAGQEPRALALAGPLGQRMETEPQIYGKLIPGEPQLNKGHAP